MLSPVNGLMSVPGDPVQGIVGATLQGDPQLLLSLSGTFQNAFVIVEATPLGQPVGTWQPYSEVRIDTGYVIQQAVIGPVSNPGFGSGITLRADGSAISAIRLRLLSIGQGAVSGGIAGVPFPFSSVVQVITGTVNLAGQTMASAGDQVPTAAVFLNSVAVRTGNTMDIVQEEGPGAARMGNPEEKRLLELILLEITRCRVALGELANVDDLDQRVTADDTMALMG